MKWYGKIGCAEYSETSPGVYTEEIIDRYYYGDILKNVKKFNTSNEINDNIIFSERVSIAADTFALSSFPHMKYIEIFGTKWKIADIEIEYPRMIITTGGVYNEQTESGTSGNS